MQVVCYFMGFFKVGKEHLRAQTRQTNIKERMATEVDCCVTSCRLCLVQKAAHDKD